MSSLPSFLPPMVNLCPDETLNDNFLYEIFREDFLLNSPTHQGTSLLLNRNLREGKESSYWHLTRYGYSRYTLGMFDFDRSKRLCWVKPTIQSPPSIEIDAFDYLEDSGRVRRYLWVRKAKFVVILEPAIFGGALEHYRLITSFYVDFSHKEKDLQAKYNNRLV